MKPGARLFVRRRVSAAFALAVLLVGAIGVIAYSSASRFAETAGQIAHTCAVETHLGKVLGEIHDIEIGARDYVITGDDGHLQSYRGATARVESALKELRRVTAGNPSQQQRLDSLEPLVHQAVTFWEQAINARSAAGQQAGTETVPVFEGKVTTDAIRDLIDDMRAEEWEQLQQGEATEHASGRDTLRSFGLLAVLIVALLAIVAHLVRHEASVRQRAQAVLLAAYEESDRRVEERTADLARSNALLREEVAQHKRAQEARRESEQRFAQFMRYLPGVAFMKDVEGRYVYMNDTFERLFHHKLSESERVTDEQLWPAPIVAQFRKNDDHVARTGTALQTTEKVPHDDGMHEWLVTKFPILNGDGTVRLVGGVAIDITERRRAETELRELQERAQQRERLADIGAITAQVAHDLGNPLAGLSMQAQLLLQRIKRDGTLPVSTIVQLVERIITEVRHLDALIREFMDFSREQRLDLKCINLSGFLQQVVEVWQPVATARDIALTVDQLPNGLSLTADDEKLRRVLDNLVKNAIEAIDRGPGQVSIHVTVPGPEAVCISVADTGPGIPETLQAFRLFETTKPQGTGLGLAVVKQIVLAHHGKVRFDRLSPHGTAFHVELPCRGPLPA
jgi:PAS domain S-box-containing protein